MKVYIVACHGNEKFYGAVGVFVIGAFTDFRSACKCAIRVVEDELFSRDDVYVEVFDGDNGAPVDMWRYHNIIDKRLSICD